MADTQNQAGAKPEAASSTGATPESSAGQQPHPEQPGATPEPFETWLAKQPADIQERVEGQFTDRTRRLESALSSERDEKKKLDKELKKLAGALKEGSAEREAVDRLRTERDEANQRADNVEAAHAAGARTPRVAIAAARELGLLSDHGRVDFAELRKQAPELFEPTQRTAASTANAGAGMAPGSARGSSLRGMNQFIRQAAGKT